jgi:hypothetical protein
VGVLDLVPGNHGQRFFHLDQVDLDLLGVLRSLSADDLTTLCGHDEHAGRQPGGLSIPTAEQPVLSGAHPGLFLKLARGGIEGQFAVVDGPRGKLPHELA